MSRSVAIVTFLFAWTLATHGKYSASGDEPHYLMIAQSLVADHDLDLENNYAGDDGRLFGHQGLEMGPHVTRDRQGHLESVHDIGLPWLLTPAYVSARTLARATSPALLARFRMDQGLFAYSLVGLVLIGLTAVGAGVLARTVVVSTGRRDAALLVGLAAISPPIVSHAFLVFPEVIALFLTSIVVWYAIAGPADAHGSRLMAIISALGVLPWVHRKYTLYAIALLLVIAVMRPEAWRAMAATRRAIAAAIFALSVGAFFGWTWYRWGNLGGPQMLGGVPFSAQSFRNGVAGLLVDRQSGLVSYGPIYWMVPVAWLLTWRQTWPLLAPALVLYLPMAAFVEWWGGFAPAARYITPIAPLCLVAMAHALRFRVVRVALTALAIPQLAIDAIVWQHPRALWAPGADNPALESLGPLGRAYEGALPAIRGESHEVPLLFFVLAASAVTALLVVLASRRQPDVQP